MTIRLIALSAGLLLLSGAAYAAPAVQNAKTAGQYAANSYAASNSYGGPASDMGSYDARPQTAYAARQADRNTGNLAPRVDSNADGTWTHTGVALHY